MFSIGDSTFRDVESVLRSLQEAQKDFPRLWEKALNDAGDIAHKYYLRQFSSEGGEFGTKWKQLAIGTQKQRKRKGYKPAHPILVRRGWLRASVSSKTSAHARRIVSQRGIVLESTLKTKTGLNLYELHQKGGKHLPARKISKEGDPPFISKKGWDEIKTRFLGMFIELRRKMERKR